MVSIKNIDQIVSLLTKAGKTSGVANDRAVYNFFEKMTCGYGKDASPIVYKGANLENIPDFLKPMLKGLRTPQLLLMAVQELKVKGFWGLQ